MKKEMLLNNRLGVFPKDDGFCFRTYAPEAKLVDLCLFKTGESEMKLPMQSKGQGIWECMTQYAYYGIEYGFRVSGDGHLPQKLLMDPYGHGMTHQCEFKPCMLGAGGFEKLNSAESGLRSVVVDDQFEWQGDESPFHPWKDLIIYEMHVKGFTQLNEAIPKELRGTYAGLAHPESLQYLKRLGVTAVQLLPIHAHLHDEFLLKKGLTNYWGYNTVSYFVVHPEYAYHQSPQACLNEFKGMVKALHQAGIEVILDVVYNHTAEGGEQGAWINLRGLAEKEYYRTQQDEEDLSLSYYDSTGCGNTVHTATAAGLKLVMDSLRYWVEEMHVDGFRFDLAVSVGRNEKHAYSQMSPVLAAIGQDPVLSKVKWIAEPWDIFQLDSYQLGNFPKNWAELNGKYRDGVRSFWSNRDASTADFSKRFCGSQEIYNWNGRSPSASINFITSHDGFTLRDLVMYEKKDNLKNLEQNRDGDDHQISQNFGVEGVTQDQEINAKRAQCQRNMMVSLMGALGTPFLTAGDESGRSQGGNNNAYCQDNEISWLNWSDRDEGLFEWTAYLIGLRKKLKYLQSEQYFTGRSTDSRYGKDIYWLNEKASVLTHEQWHLPEFGVFGALIPLGYEDRLNHDENGHVVLLFNRTNDEVDFQLPIKNLVLNVLYDTSYKTPIFEVDKELQNGVYKLGSQSAVCLRLPMETIFQNTLAF